VSHFSTLKVQLKDMALARRLAERRGWTVEQTAEFVNPWRAANESVKDCTVFRDTKGQPKLVVDRLGNVIHDAWSMGRDAFSFLQDYSEAFIRKTAAAEGAQVINKGTDANGCRVLEIEYAY